MVASTVIYLFTELMRIIVTLTRPVADKILDIIGYLWIGKTRKLPPITNKILLIPATELAEKIRKRQITSEEVIKAYIERSKAVHHSINAVVDERYEDALEDARNIDRRLASSTKSEEEIARETPLLGLPFSCKEIIGVKGMAQTAGLVRAKDRKAEEDSHSAALYRKAGAIPVTVTNIPELCMWWGTYNNVFGWTRNPFDNRRTVGGSTGGECALITSAGALFGIGNDIGGSIRFPASFCGIYGHKPSQGVVPNYGPYPFSTEHPDDDHSDVFCSTGPLCRYAKDLNLLLKVLSDNDQRLKLDQRVNFKKVKLYYMEEFPGLLHAAVPEVKKAVKKAVKHFEEEYNLKATPLQIDELKDIMSIWVSKVHESGMAPVEYYVAGKGKKINAFWEFLKGLIGCSDHIIPVLFFAMMSKRLKSPDQEKYLQKYQELERKFNHFFQDKEALLLVPTYPEPAPHTSVLFPKSFNGIYCAAFNVLGLPATNIPAGLSIRGLPFGIQAVSGMFQDRLTLAAALELDTVFNGWHSPSAIKV